MNRSTPSRTRRPARRRRVAAIPAPTSALLLLLALLPLGSPAAAQSDGCATPEHRAFDFWIGRWEVRTPDGALAGHNTIRRAMDGCVLHERYTTPAGYEGESLNVYDASRGVWHQTWTDDTGLLLLLEGGLRGDTMVLEGETVDTAGAVVRQRIAWWVVDGNPDRVRQRWARASSTGGWTTVFDGLYLRRRDPEAAPSAVAPRNGTGPGGAPRPRPARLPPGSGGGSRAAPGATRGAR